MPPKLIEVAQVRTADGVPILNGYLQQGWALIGITDSTYHIGRYEPDEDDQRDWRYGFVEWVSALDPAEIDRKTLEGMGMGDQGGAASYIRTFKQLLGFEPEPVLNDDEGLE